MEKLVGYCLSVLLVAGFSSVSAQEEEVYLEKGGTLLVAPSPVSGEITSIAWKLKGNFVAEWVKDIIPVKYYAEFDGRTNLNTNTGSLEINNMRPTDSGLFSVEINNNVQSKTYNVKVLKAVPKPTVVIPPACNHESKQCTLVCEGNTEGAEPVTYSWNLGGDEWKNEGKNWNITNDETIHHVEKFICRIKNRISVEESDPKDNPFYHKWSLGKIIGLTVGLICGAALVPAAFLIWRQNQKNKQRITSTDGKNPKKSPEEEEELAKKNTEEASTPEKSDPRSV